jgi:hypothetical protein
MKQVPRHRSRGGPLLDVIAVEAVHRRDARGRHVTCDGFGLAEIALRPLDEVAHVALVGDGSFE